MAGTILEARNLEKLQVKIKDFIIRGWEPEGQIKRDVKTGMVTQKMIKKKGLI